MLSEQVSKFSHKDQNRTVVHVFVVDMLLFFISRITSI